MTVVLAAVIVLVTQVALAQGDLLTLLGFKIEPFVAANGTVVLAIVPETTNTTWNETFDVVVEVQAGTQHVDAGAAYLNFDPVVLQVESVAAGGILSSEFQNEFDNDAGTVGYAAFTLSDFPDGTFTLCTVTFMATAVSDGTTVEFNTTGPRTSDATYGGWSVLDEAIDGLVVVNPGTGQVTVPDVVGLSESEAETAITSAGLRVGIREELESQSVPLSHVISQLPMGDASVAAGMPVDLVISSGTAAEPGDINGDSSVDAVDIQFVINDVLGIDTGHDCDINGDGTVDAMDIQLAINAALGLPILV